MNDSDSSAPEGNASSRVTREQLARVFRECEKPPEQFRLGAESEKFGVHQETGQPLGYGEDFGVCKVLDSLAQDHGWTPYREHDQGPVVALKRDGASVTLEPGGQLELSGAPLADLHQVWQEELVHLEEIRPVSERLGIAWLASGFHPLARREQLPWVPKRRYPIMREYLPTRGGGALDMMQRTATVQANFDWSSERDGMSKLVVGLKIAPILHALFANSPFEEGRLARDLSRRGRVWLDMDPSRSGLVPPLWAKQDPSYEDWVEWTLDAGMFLFVRAGRIVPNTGQSFRDFLANGYQGHRATLEDYRLHLTTLFPEVRLKSTIEVRSFDSLPPRLAMAAKALWTGLLYDEQSLSQAREMVQPWDVAGMSDARPGLVRRGLEQSLYGQSGWHWAERLVDLAERGLARRARLEAGRDEGCYLLPARELLSQRTSPAEQACQEMTSQPSIVAATRIELPWAEGHSLASKA